jgi:hypothetical protein
MVAILAALAGAMISFSAAFSFTSSGDTQSKTERNLSYPIRDTGFWRLR